jgi:hypothetical protein
MRMKTILLILLVCNSFSTTEVLPQKTRLLYPDDSPTTYGIQQYVNNRENQDKWFREYQELIRDTLYNDIQYQTEKFNKSTDNRHDPDVLAYIDLFQSSDAVVHVDIRERYRGLELKTFKPYRTEDDYFLRSTIYHEISHYYFFQCQMELTRVRHLHVDQYWCKDLILLPQAELRYGQHFIEEGLCQYLVQLWGESPEFKTIVVPVDQRDFQKPDKEFDLVYKYASKYLKPYLDSCIRVDGRVKQGVLQILEHRPPNYKEILEPHLYFDRLKTRPEVFMENTLLYEFKANHN